MNLTDLRPLPRWDLLCYLVAALLVGLPWRTYAAEDSPFSTASADWQGLSEFVRTAQAKWGSGAVQVTATLDYGSLSPSDSLIIVAPSTGLDGDSLTAFLAAGGRVALLDDYGKSADFLARFGVRRLSATERPLQSLDNDPELAIATPATQAVSGAREGRHPMTLGVERVVTNHPMLLQHPDLTPVLEVPFSNGTSGTLAVTGIISGRGRLLVLADPSVFINLMLRYPGNRVFAEGMFDYLLERAPGGAGSRTLWIVTTNFTQTGHFGQRQGLSEQFHEGLNSLSEAARELRAGGLPPALALLLAGALALVLLSAENRRNISPALEVTPGYARARPLAAQAGPASRAEVLSGASPLLSVLEMDVALRETLEIRLGVSSGLTPRELEPRLVELGLSTQDAAGLSTLLARTRELGATLTRRRPARPSRGELKQLHQEAMHLLSVLKLAEQRR